MCCSVVCISLSPHTPRLTIRFKFLQNPWICRNWATFGTLRYFLRSLKFNSLSVLLICWCGWPFLPTAILHSWAYICLSGNSINADILYEECIRLKLMTYKKKDNILTAISCFGRIWPPLIMPSKLCAELDIPAIEK